MTTIEQLEETARQEEMTADHFNDLANKQPERYQHFKGLAALAKNNRDNALLAIKAIKEAAQYDQFGKGDQDE